MIGVVLIHHNLHCFPDHFFFVQEQINLSCADACELTHHDILGHTLENFVFSVYGSVHQHINCLFE